MRDTMFRLANNLVVSCSDEAQEKERLNSYHAETLENLLCNNPRALQWLKKSVLPCIVDCSHSF